MVDFLFQATLSNLLVSTILAAIACVVQRRVRSASLANLLWAIVLIKMVTPPLFSLPVVEVPRIFSSSVPAADVSSELPPVGMTDSIFGAADLTLPLQTESPTSNTASPTTAASVWSRSSGLAVCAWIAVSATLFFISAFRIVRFHWLLKAHARVHPGLSSGLCRDVARQLGVRRCPDVVVSSANVAPFVWWMAGRSVIVVSEQAIRQLSDCDLRFVITHEMAHIKRRDHWFRWLEWFALLGLWWNPVMWWARTQLRISEEMACDDLVLQTPHPEVHQYANSLLNLAELLSSPAIRPPAVASAINSGGNLEKRLKMMIAEKTWRIPAALRGAIVALAFCIFPLGLVGAQDFEAVERRLKGAVEAGELTREQAGIMLQALKRSGESQHADDREMEAKKRRYLEFTEKIEAAVAAGKLSKEDAEKELIGLRKEMFRDAGEKEEARSEKGEVREMEARERRYLAYARELKAAIAAGKLSREDAEQKLLAVRKDLFGDGGEKKEARDVEARERRYLSYAEIEAAVVAGKLSKEDAQKKLLALRKEPYGDAGEKKEAQGAKGENRDMEARERRYLAYAREIEAAIAAGKLSKEDAEQKLIAVRKDLFGNAGEKKEARGDRGEDRDLEVRENRYLQYVREIEAAVKAGKISKEDAEKKLMAVRRAMSREESDDDRSDREMEDLKRRYELATKRIKAAIERGDISAEEGEEKLIELRKEMFGGGD